LLSLSLTLSGLVPATHIEFLDQVQAPEVQVGAANDGNSDLMKERTHSHIHIQCIHIHIHVACT